MQWPWQGSAPKDSVVIAYSGDAIAWVQARNATGLPRPLARCGVVPRGDDALPDLAKRLRGLGLPSQAVVAVLQLPQCQLLQIESPAVPPEELKAAARWRIKDMVEAHLDDLTLDVMHVGDERPRAQKQSFVAAAPNSAIHDITTLCAGSGLQLSAIDIRETAQRNLQSALARAAGQHERATALLMLHGDQCLLTISANDELFYTRRLDWDDSAIASAIAPPTPASSTNDFFSHPLHALDGAEMPDIVDYSAEPDTSASHVDTPRLVIELQRSFDVWERSWPELPLAAVTVEAGEHSQALATLLGQQMGIRVGALDIAPVFGGFEQACGGDAAVMRACLPLLGTLLRSETRKP